MEVISESQVDFGSFNSDPTVPIGLDRIAVMYFLGLLFLVVIDQNQSELFDQKWMAQICLRPYNEFIQLKGARPFQHMSVY